MLFNEKRLHYYVIDLEDESVSGYETEEIHLHSLRWRVKSALYKYLNKKFIENDSNGFYNFKHDNVLILITDKEKKIEEISSFLQKLFIDKKLVEIYNNCPLDKFDNTNQEIFNHELDKIYDYYMLESELNKNNKSNKMRIKI